MADSFENLPPKIRAAGQYLILCHCIEIGSKTNSYTPSDQGARSLTEQESRVKVAALQVFYRFFTGEDDGGAGGGDGGRGGEDAGDGIGGDGKLQSGGEAAGAGAAAEKPKATTGGCSC